jgi:hypothetical protein
VWYWARLMKNHLGWRLGYHAEETVNRLVQSIGPRISGQIPFCHFAATRNRADIREHCSQRE